MRTLDQLALEAALRLNDRAHAIHNSYASGSVTDLMFVNTSDFTALSSFTSEASLLAGNGGRQPFVPAQHCVAGGTSFGKSFLIMAQGVLSSTGTPTYTFQVRLGSTAGSASLAGGSVGVTAALTTASGITNKWWMLQLNLVVTVPGMGSGNATIAGAGFVESPGGLASPFCYPLEPTTPDTATWTQTFDANVAQYFNLSVTCSANSASNTIQCKQFMLLGLN